MLSPTLHAGAQSVKKVTATLEVQSFCLTTGEHLGQSCRLAGACRADLYPGLSQAGGDDAHSSQRLMGGQHKRRE